MCPELYQQWVNLTCDLRYNNFVSLTTDPPVGNAAT